MAKFNVNVNGNVYRWDEENEKDGEYVGRVSDDGDFIPAEWGNEEIEQAVLIDLKRQYDSEEGWAQEEFPEEILRFIAPTDDSN